MATSALLTDQTTNGYGTPVEVSGEATIDVPSNVTFDGAQVQIETAANNTAAEFTPVGYRGVFSRPGALQLDRAGTYFVRAGVFRAGSNTSISVSVTT